jgi:choline dehydrogenase
VVELNLADDARDIDGLMAGARLAWALVRSEPIQALTQSVFLWNDTIMRSDALLRNAIHRLLGGTWHAVGTARMGNEADPMAVVDSRCRVHSHDNLYVVDASVMPCIPSTPTNLTCIMLAERVAAWMKEAQPWPR